MKAIPTTTEGLRFILGVLNKVEDHNIGFYTNMIRFMVEQKPPFKSSLIYFEPANNMFKYISRSKLMNIPVVQWGKNTPGKVELLQFNRFAYLTVEPFSVMVSSADFLVADVPDRPKYFYDYVNRTVADERKAISSLLQGLSKESKLF